MFKQVSFPSHAYHLEIHCLHECQTKKLGAPEPQSLGPHANVWVSGFQIRGLGALSLFLMPKREGGTGDPFGVTCPSCFAWVALNARHGAHFLANPLPIAAIKTCIAS